MKGFLCFALSCMLPFSLSAWGSCDNGQKTGTMNSSSIIKENNRITSENAQEDISLLQSIKDTVVQTELSGDVSNAVSREQRTPPPIVQQSKMVSKMNVQIGSSIFTATLEENSAVSLFVERMKRAPVVIEMSDYGGFEKVGSLGSSFPASNTHITAQAGDIVLYNGNQIVLFYGSNSWSYTRLGKIDNLSGWEEALGSGDVQVTFKLE